MVLSDLEETVNIFVEHYKENEEKALMFKTNNTFEYQVNWKELLAEGRDRRHVIDVELYRNTSRIDRYHKTKQELKEKLDSLQGKKGEYGKQGASRKGDLQQKKFTHLRQKSSKRMGEEKSRIG
jgi:hypothetical protein